eukprot:8878803-Alexandrium_andersonii.AAC.1
MSMSRCLGAAVQMKGVDEAHVHCSLARVCGDPDCMHSTRFTSYPRFYPGYPGTSVATLALLSEKETGRRPGLQDPRGAAGVAEARGHLQRVRLVAEVAVGVGRVAADCVDLEAEVALAM